MNNSSLLSFSRSYEGRQPDGGDLEGCSIIDFWSYRETSNWHDTPCAASVTNQFLCQMKADLEGEARTDAVSKYKYIF